MDKQELTKFYKLHNLAPADIFKDKRGFVFITRSGVEKIQNQNNIKVAFEMMVCEIDNVVIKAVSMRFDSDANDFIPLIETFGSANTDNCRNTFKVEVAEKRALARCIIKTMQWTNVMGEDEIENQPNETLNKLK
tara:strand:+ start:16995 stop:17399 length:405 start_codon:yes stop_codon:yes gene_type:complete